MDTDMKCIYGIAMAVVVLIFGAVIIACVDILRKNELIAKSEDPIATACALKANDKICSLVNRTQR